MRYSFRCSRRASTAVSFLTLGGPKFITGADFFCNSLLHRMALVSPLGAAKKGRSKKWRSLVFLTNIAEAEPIRSSLKGTLC